MTKIFMVEAISQHRIVYAVQAENKELAVKTIEHCNDEQLKEAAQQHLGEQLITCYQVSREQYIDVFDSINDYLKQWPDNEKMKYIIDSKQVLELKVLKIKWFWETEYWEFKLWTNKIENRYLSEKYKWILYLGPIEIRMKR